MPPSSFQTEKISTSLLVTIALGQRDYHRSVEHWGVLVECINTEAATGFLTGNFASGKVLLHCKATFKPGDRNRFELDVPLELRTSDWAVWMREKGDDEAKAWKFTEIAKGLDLPLFENGLGPGNALLKLVCSWGNNFERMPVPPTDLGGNCADVCRLAVQRMADVGILARQQQAVFEGVYEREYEDLKRYTWDRFKENDVEGASVWELSEPVFDAASGRYIPESVH